MMHRTSSALAAVWLTLGCATTDIRQELRIDTLRGDSYECTGCSIVAESVAYLPHPDDSVAVETWGLPERDSRGRYLMIEGSARRSVLVFGSNGRLEHTFGKAGQGPGEFSRVTDIKVGKGDSLLIFDTKRVHVFSPSFEYVREYPLSELARPYRGQGVVLRDGRMVLPASANRISIVNRDGSLDSATKSGVAGPWQPLAQRSIGIWLEGSDTVRCLDCGRRYVREAHQSETIWSGPMNMYVIENHDLTGRLLQRVAREVKWFAPWGSSVTPADVNQGLRQELTRPKFVGARQSSDGLLWATVHREDPQNPIPADFDFPKALQQQFPDVDQRLETLVEVIDPRESKLLASTRMRGQAMLMSDGLLALFVPDSVNVRAAKIIRLRLERRK